MAVEIDSLLLYAKLKPQDWDCSLEWSNPLSIYLNAAEIISKTQQLAMLNPSVNFQRRHRDSRLLRESVLSDMAVQLAFCRRFELFPPPMKIIVVTTHSPHHDPVANAIVIFDTVARSKDANMEC